MSYHPRIEVVDLTNFITSRTRNCELWFVNNKALETEVLTNLAKCTDRYDVDLYAFALQGDHHHEVCIFKKPNRSDYQRDFKSGVARAVQRLCPEYPGGRLYGRRFSNEFVPTDQAIEEQFFYTVLQPVQDGLVEKISDFPAYNCFHDAVHGITRKFTVTKWAEFRDAKRWNKQVHIRDFQYTVKLKYKRLPGYEDLSQKEYAKLMYKKLEERRQAILKKRREAGKYGFLGRDRLMQVRPGQPAKNPKRSSYRKERPRILSKEPKILKEMYDWYFKIYFNFKDASERYRSGEKDVIFPKGTYKPPLFTAALSLDLR